MNVVSFGSGKSTFVAHGGFVGNWELWQQPFELMSKKWHCISYDHRGCGESPAPPELITREAIVDDLFAVLDLFHIEKCVLAGESMGSRIVMLAALQQPERFEGLVLIGSSMPVVEPLAENSKQFISAMRTDYKATMTQFVEDCLPEPDADQYKKWGLDICLRSTPEAAEKLIRIFESKSEDEYTYPIEDITVPTLIIHGTKDISPLEGAQQIANKIPNAELVVLDGVGHVPVITRPHEVVKIIEKKFPI